MFDIKPFYNFSFWITIPSFLKKKFSTDHAIFTNNLSFSKNFFKITKKYNIFNNQKKNQKLSNLKNNFKSSLKVFKKKLKHKKKKNSNNLLKKYHRKSKKSKLNFRTILLQDVDITDTRTSKFFYQYAYKFFLSTYYSNNNKNSLFLNEYVLDKNISKEENLKRRFLLFRLLNNLIFLYEELQIKNFLRKYYVLLFTYSQLILMNYISNNAFNFKFFYKQNYIN